jgi:hypothetical protein
MADRADEASECWPSIENLVIHTCFRRTAVIAGIKWLEAHAVVVADRSNGRHTRYRLTPTSYRNQSVSRTGSSPAPVRLATTTSPPDERDQSVSRTAPVRQTDTKPQEATRNHKSKPHSLAHDERFSEFWTAYPRKIGDKKRAAKYWKTRNLDAKADEIIADVIERAAKDPQWQDLKFVPHPTTFLNAERWNDDWRAATRSTPRRLSAVEQVEQAIAANRRGHVIEGRFADGGATSLEAQSLADSAHALKALGASTRRPRPTRANCTAAIPASLTGAAGVNGIARRA